MNSTLPLPPSPTPQPSKTHSFSAVLLCIAVATGVGALLIPLAPTTLGAIPAFFHITTTASIFCLLLCAYLLISGFVTGARPRDLGLAATFVATAIFIIAYDLAVPGGISQHSVIAPNHPWASAAWFWSIAHIVFPLGVVLSVIPWSYSGSRLSRFLAVRRRAAASAVIGGAVIVATGASILILKNVALLPAIIKPKELSSLSSTIGSYIVAFNLAAVPIVASWTWKIRSPQRWISLAVAAEGIDALLYLAGQAKAQSVGWYASELFGLAASATLLIAMLREMSRLYLVHMQLRHRASTDALTGVLARPAVLEWASLLAEKYAVSGSRFCLGLLDVDHFKRVNDELGHLAGDAVLSEVANRIRAALRDGDVVGRYGGEEFLLLFPATDRANGLAAAERVLTEIRGSAVNSPAGVVSVSASLGLTMVTPGDGLNDLIARADAVLYEAKRSGRDQVMVDKIVVITPSHPTALQAIG